MTPDQDMIVSEERLREILAAATEAFGFSPGEWTADQSSDPGYLDTVLEALQQPGQTSTVCMVGGSEMDEQNAVSAHIANCNPQTVTAIITELLALRPKEAGEAVASGAAVEEALERLWDSIPAGEVPSYPQTLAAIKSASPPSPVSRESVIAEALTNALDRLELFLATYGDFGERYETAADINDWRAALKETGK